MIAGREWPIPLLAPRQNRIVVPLLLTGKNDYESLSVVAYMALTRAHRHVSRTEFDDWPVPYCELVDAVPVIARQTGLVKSTGCAAFQAACRHDAGAPDWDAIIAQFVNFLPGTTPDYWEDALTVPRLEAMTEEWRLHPPVAVLVAGYLGYKPKPRDVDAIEQLVRLFPGGQLRLN